MSNALISLNPVQRAVVAPFILHGFADLNLLNTSDILCYCACVPVTVLAGNCIPTETIGMFVLLSWLHVQNEPIDLIGSLLICSYTDAALWETVLGRLQVDKNRFQTMLKAMGMFSLLFCHKPFNCLNLPLFFGIDFVLMYFCSVHVLSSRTLTAGIFGLISLCSLKFLPESFAASTNSLWAAIGLATSHIILHLQAK